ncbi:MAG: 2-C-methyl-D-erythritol 4-phosphate cytidylyltransferase [Lachnospiraceae bacterium]|jgi:ribonuclease HI|nr:2-C-methyl-D-erythritol 4-phosphate cytidylyltransferase [Lachnospiraceae bacterium]
MDKNEATAIIAAGGKGERTGLNIPKQYVEINGKPVLAYTIEAFQNNSLIDHIIIVAGEDYIDFCKENIVLKYGFSKVKHIIKGGESRMLSVYEGVKLCEDSGIILIHDGARPFVTQEEIKKAYEGAFNKNACILACPSTETLKAVKDGIIEKTIDRSLVYSAKTPQAFKGRLIKQAYEKALKDGYSATDDASLLEYIGEPVYIEEGSFQNIKITSSEDIIYAEYLLNSREHHNDNPLTLSENKENTEILKKEKESTEEAEYHGKRKNVTIYTDGACSYNPGPGGYGAVIIYNGKELEISQGYKKTTNNRMEIMGVLAALSALKEPCDVALYSDSKYVVDAIEKGWVTKWKKNNWMRNKNDKALNVDLWIELLTLLERHNVQFHWVKGHSSNALNNKCDELARKSILFDDLLEDYGFVNGEII